MRMKASRPEPAPYDLSLLPQLNGVCESLRAEITEYVDYMAATKKRPTTIHLKPRQLDSLRKGINAKIDKAAPPLGELNFRGIPVVATAREVEHAP